MAMVRINSEAFREWAHSCVEALSAERAGIDGLNVFPVADSDTGTNVLLTFTSGLEAVAQVPEDADLSKALFVYARGLLTGARGNSGIICAELVRSALQALAEGAEVHGGELSADRVATAFEAGSAAAWAAVSHPQVGTILSVAEAAAAAARTAASQGGSAKGAAQAAVDAAEEALLLTPSQMPLLAQAGVVDAGGWALVIVLRSVLLSVGGHPRSTHVGSAEATRGDVGVGAAIDLDPDGPAYEVMYLFDATDEAVSVLRQRLDEIGDSLVIVGGDGLWNVHVHTDDVGAAIEVGIEHGRPHQIRVTHFVDQVAAGHSHPPHPTQGRAVLSAAYGAGLAELTRACGVEAIEFSPTAPLTAEGVEAAIDGLDATEVLVLPNRAAHIAIFEAAAANARRHGKRVTVLPTQVQVQGLAAIAVHDPEASFDADVVAMSTAAGHVKHGAVTFAVEDGITTAGPCRVGDTLGVVNGDFAIVGKDFITVALEVADRLDVRSAELVTLVQGANCPAGLVDELGEKLRKLAPHLDVAVHDGGQPVYPLFIAVE